MNVSYDNYHCFLQTIRDQDLMETTANDLQITDTLNETAHFSEYDLSLQIQAFGRVIIVTLGLIGMSFDF